MTLLMNGCSFTDIWKPSDDFVKALGCESVVNLGIEATSFQRTVRSSIEWIAQNGNPKFVLIPITFSHRWELALNLHDKPIEGSWIPLQNSNFIRDDIKLQGTNAKDLKKLVDDYYKIIPNVKTYYDKLFTDIILFANYLENNNIRYLMFNMCNNFDKKDIEGYQGFEKVKLIEQNKNIMDLWSFCANEYMFTTMKSNTDIDRYGHHHDPEQYKQLEKHILNYII